MIPLKNKPNVITTDTNYPAGRIKDDTGADDGTPVNDLVYNDIHQFFERLMALGGVTANNQPDNSYSGYQLIAALLAYVGARSKIYSLPSWDMDAVASIDVITDPFPGSIVDVRCIIYDDPSGFDRNGRSLLQAGDYQIRPFSVSPNKVTLTRTASGIFDSTSYNDTSVSRGFLILDFN